ncbi:hypothetical protein [Paradesulfitobacterium ferrireducens]|uniref:hypothetical protein n=1 Tax=Paradesulfitobacterium ferrireducens TaxID=2816476 RepID=UPI001A90A2C4|nr:hypothetical protein [Paradesulfitobacterium ferrireducens]
MALYKSHLSGHISNQLRKKAGNPTAWVEFQTLGVLGYVCIIFGMSVIGLQAHLIRVEVDVANGLPSFEIVGPYPIYLKV